MRPEPTSRDFTFDVDLDGKHKATVVMVFASNEGMDDQAKIKYTTNMEAIITDAEEQFERIFLVNTAAGTWAKEPEQTDETSRRLIVRSGIAKVKVLQGKGRVTKEAYFEVVRDTIVKLLAASNFTLESFGSVDGDELFLKIGLDTENKILPRLADRYLYAMPFKNAAYKDMPSKVGEKISGAPPAPPTNDLGAAPAYEIYKDESEQGDADKKLGFDEFQPIDKIRLASHRVSSLMSINELRKQKVITKFFVATSEADLGKFDSWVGKTPGELFWLCINPFKFCINPFEFCCPSAKLCCPSAQDSALVNDDIRNFFGEEIAFFFIFYEYLIKMMIPLGVVGFFVQIIQYEGFNIDYDTENTAKRYFGYAIVFWASYMQVNFNKTASAYVQRWGTKAQTIELEEDCEGYDEKMSASKTTCLDVVGTFLMILYCFVFTAAFYVGMAYAKKDQEPIVTSILIKLFSFAWGKLAKKLVDRQNHQKPQHVADALAFNLSVVKLFLYMFPFVRLAFLKNLKSKVCGESLKDVADTVFGKHGWPTGVDQDNYLQWYPEYTFEIGKPAFNFTHHHKGAVEDEFDILQTFSRMVQKAMEADTRGTGAKVCAWGCYPTKCDLDPDGTGTASCLTDCYGTVQSSLDTLFFIHVATTILFILIAKVNTVIAIREESKGKATTTLQVQAKKYDTSRYEYMEWGGSYVEDMLEVILGLAIIVCFGVFEPILVVYAIFINTIEYRLLAYRMVRITHRPFPRLVKGIQSWNKVMDTIGCLSAFINAGLMVFFNRGPMRRKCPEDKLILFIVYVLIFTMLRLTLETLYPKETADVVAADLRNGMFREMVHARQRIHKRKAQEFVDLVDGKDIFGKGRKTEMQDPKNYIVHYPKAEVAASP